MYRTTRVNSQALLSLARAEHQVVQSRVTFSLYKLGGTTAQECTWGLPHPQCMFNSVSTCGRRAANVFTPRHKGQGPLVKVNACFQVRIPLSAEDVKSVAVSDLTENILEFFFVITFFRPSLVVRGVGGGLTSAHSPWARHLCADRRALFRSC